METNNLREEVQIDIKQAFFLLLDKIVIILLAGVLAALVALGYTKFMIDPVYTTSTQIYIYVESSSNKTTTSDIAVAGSLSSDYAVVIKTSPVYEAVVENLGLSISPSAIGGMISVSTIEDTRQVVIYAKSTDPYLAQEVANMTREVASERIEEVMKDSGVSVSTVYEAALPTSPSSPNISKNTLIGFAAGIIIAVAIILLRFILDDTIKSPDDIERYLNLSVLASIPVHEDGTSKKGKNKKKKKAKKTKRRAG